MEKPRQKDERYRLYRLLEVGKKALAMDEDAFRLMLVRHGAQEVDGVPSRRTMDLGQLHDVVVEMKRKGFRPTPRGGQQAARWRKPRIQKITAIWCAMADAGVVRNRSEAAMVKWCATLTRKARLEWATSEDLNACVEALKDWARREGVQLDD